MCTQPCRARACTLDLGETPRHQAEQTRLAALPAQRSDGRRLDVVLEQRERLLDTAQTAGECTVCVVRAPRERDAAIGGAWVAIVTIGRGPSQAAAGYGIADLGPVARVAVVAGHEDAGAAPADTDVAEGVGAPVVARRSVVLVAFLAARGRIAVALSM